MPVISVRTALGASSTATPLSGSQYEYLPFDAFVEFGIVADAVGVLATVISGSDVLMEEGPVILGSAINVMPRYPDDYLLNDDAVAGDRLSVRLRDTSAAARVVLTVCKITPT
jgi:hypothetical protein